MSPRDRRVARGVLRNSTAAAGVLPRRASVRPTPNPYPYRARRRVRPTKGRGPNRPRREGPKKNRSLYTRRVPVRDMGSPPAREESPALWSLRLRLARFLREAQEDLFEALARARAGLCPEGR